MSPSAPRLSRGLHLIGIIYITSSLLVMCRDITKLRLIHSRARKVYPKSALRAGCRRPPAGNNSGRTTEAANGLWRSVEASPNTFFARASCIGSIFGPARIYRWIFSDASISHIIRFQRPKRKSMSVFCFGPCYREMVKLSHGSLSYTLEMHKAPTKPL